MATCWHHLSKTVFTTLFCLCSLVKVQLTVLSVFTYGLSRLCHRSVCLALCQEHRFGDCSFIPNWQCQPPHSVLPQYVWVTLELLPPHISYSSTNLLFYLLVLLGIKLYMKSRILLLIGSALILPIKLEEQNLGHLAFPSVDLEWLRSHTWLFGYLSQLFSQIALMYNFARFVFIYIYFIQGQEYGLVVDCVFNTHRPWIQSQHPTPMRLRHLSKC